MMNPIPKYDDETERMESEAMAESKKPITPDEINSAYNVAARSRIIWSAREAALIRADDELRQAEVAAVNAGTLANLKNEVQREAKLREVCALEHAKLMAAQVDVLQARMNFDVAKLEIERIDTHLRLMEIEKA